jgi:hypothetical protein
MKLPVQVIYVNKMFLENDHKRAISLKSAIAVRNQ